MGSERGQSLGALLLEHGISEARSLGYKKVYLTTDHTGYYEKYGWQSIEDGYDFSGNISPIYEINT